MRVWLEYLPQYAAVNDTLAHGVSHQMTGGHNLPAIARPGRQW